MRILHLDTERTWRGGEQQVTYLVRGLLEAGHDTLLAAPPGSAIVTRFDGWGLPAVEVEMRGEADVAGIARLARLLRRHDPDIVHMHTSHAHGLGVAASLLAGRGKRVVSRRVDFPVKGLSARLKYGRVVDRFIAITEAVADVLRSAGVATDRISIAHSGIDPDRVRGGDGARFRASVGVPDDAPLVGTVAHFAWHKGLEHLIRAWPDVVSAIPDAHLVLVGDGEDRGLLEREIAAAGVDASVLLPGFRRDVPDVLAALDVFVLPSVMEGMGTSLLDAMAARRPVVASSVGGIGEIVIDGETGLLVPPRAPSILAGAIVATLTDADAVARRVDAAEARMLASFTSDAMVRATLDAYERALAATR